MFTTVSIVLKAGFTIAIAQGAINLKTRGRAPSLGIIKSIAIVVEA